MGVSATNDQGGQVLSLSKSQKKAGARAKKASVSPPPGHGGFCDKCGVASAPTATLGKVHPDCPGYAREEVLTEPFGKVALGKCIDKTDATLTGRRFYADGGMFGFQPNSLEQNDDTDEEWDAGVWISREELDKRIAENSAFVKSEEERHQKVLAESFEAEKTAKTSERHLWFRNSKPGEKGKFITQRFAAADNATVRVYDGNGGLIGRLTKEGIVPIVSKKSQVADVSPLPANVPPVTLLTLEVAEAVVTAAAMPEVSAPVVEATVSA